MRGIKPEFWTDSKVVRLSAHARLLFVGSWHYSCDNGHVTSDPIELKMRVLPADSVDHDALVEEIVEIGLYVKQEWGYLIPNFRKHQKIDPRYPLVCDHCTPEQRAEADSNRRTRGNAGSTSGAQRDPAGSTVGTHGQPTGTRRAPVGSHDEGEGEGEGEVKGGRARKRASRLPDIFKITDDMATWGREHAPLVDAPREHEKFCDYWRGVSGQRGTKADWIATWRNWMRRAQEDAEERAPKTDTRDDLPDWMRA